jgi:hypothetical protein
MMNAFSAWAWTIGLATLILVMPAKSFRALALFAILFPLIGIVGVLLLVF